MKILILLTLFVTTFFCAAKDMYEKKIDGFSAIEVIGRFTIDLEQGEDFVVKYFVDDPEIDTSDISFKVENELLIIRYSGGLAKHVDLHFEVTMPNITAIHCKNGAELKTKKEWKLKQDDLQLTARNGGKMVVEFSELDELFAKISQGGAIRVIGESQSATYEIYTGGSIAAINNNVKTVSAKINFGGEIICTASEKLKAKITSGGTVSYQGDPEVEEKIIITGNVEKL
jgi:hypothetical protein